VDQVDDDVAAAEEVVVGEDDYQANTLPQEEFPTGQIQEEEVDIAYVDAVAVAEKSMDCDS